MRRILRHAFKCPSSYHDPGFFVAERVSNCWVVATCCPVGDTTASIPKLKVCILRAFRAPAWLYPPLNAESIWTLFGMILSTH
ncbi:hypothetical protein RSAG8_00383, partial [Rhizoctonia solani AG-8 WAC10335]